MIVVRLMGGFANQLFQYATARALALERDEELFLDLSYLNSEPKGAYTKRNYELNQINVQAKMADVNLIDKFSQSGMLDKALNKLGLSNYKTFNELQANYMPSIKNLPENVLLNGYWQSEKYFSAIREKLLLEIKPSYNFNDTGNKCIEKIKSTNSVAIHVRRGDYVDLKQAAEFHGSCDLNYYKTAILMLNEKYENLNYFIFSDDLDWCKKYFSEFKNVSFVESEPNQYSSQDLFLMSNCNHQIIANSSYSWWAAWLNQFKNKTVIAPKKWFKDPSINTSDLIPKTWLSI